MKYLYLIFCFIGMFIFADHLGAQDIKPILTAAPILNIPPDARAGGMGEQGVASLPDGNAQFWNPAKNIFLKEKQIFSITYTPWLQNLVKDVFMGNLSFVNNTSENSAWGASFRYFTAGEVQLTNVEGVETTKEKPNEFAFDVSYALRFSEGFGGGIALRYIRSDLAIKSLAYDYQPANSIAFDIFGYYLSERSEGDLRGRYRFGFNLSNLGPRLKFSEKGGRDFIPSIMRVGFGYDVQLNEDNEISATLELSKLMVPTSPIRDYSDEDDDGDRTEILQGRDDDVSWLAGIFQSFGDAPGGFKEELQELNFGLGVEYSFKRSFSLRTGFYNEHKLKGGKKFLTLGAGVLYNNIHFDISYLFNTSQFKHPLENTLRFSVGFLLY